MESIGVRELRQHASRWLARVRRGQSFEVTARGVPVARLVPIDAGESTLDRLDRTGQTTVGTGGLADLEPLPVPAGSPAPSAVLDELRRGQRY